MKIIQAYLRKTKPVKEALSTEKDTDRGKEKIIFDQTLVSVGVLFSFFSQLFP